MEDNRKRGFIVTSTIGFLVTLLMLFPFVQSSKIILTAIVFCAKFMLSSSVIIQLVPLPLELGLKLTLFLKKFKFP